MTLTLRRAAAVPALILATAFAAACDDDGTAPDNQIVGDFEATSAVFTETADPANTLDVIEADGTFDMRFQQDGTFTSTLALPDRDPVVRTGTFDVQGSNIVFTESGTPRTVPFQRTTTGISFVDEADRFDFTGTGVTTPATFDATLRQR